MTYGLGRGVEHNDMPVVRAIARDAAPQNYRFSSIVLGIVNSAPFQDEDAAGWRARSMAADGLNRAVALEVETPMFITRSTCRGERSCAAWA